MSFHTEQAVTTFNQGFACSQAVLSAFAEDFGLDRETALRVSGAFGAGMARQGLTCGAVTGALMAIGLKHGKTQAEDNEARERTYALVHEFVRRFEALRNSTQCNQLLGHDMHSEAGRKAASEAGLFTSLCPALVGDAAKLVEELLEAE